jgi:hypothetical protein
MTDNKRKSEKTNCNLQNAVTAPRQGYAKDLTDVHPIGYLSGLKSNNGTATYTRDTILRLIETLKER